MFTKSTVLALFFLLLFPIINNAQWQQLNDTPFFSHHSNGFGIGDKAYVINGSFNQNLDSSNEFWEYDTTNDTWSMLLIMPSPGRTIAIGDEWDDKYYYGFGVDANGQRLNDLWVFDPAIMSFTELPSCPCTGRSHPAFIAHNGKIMMGAGSLENGDLNDWWEYDIATQVWEQKPNIPGGLRHHPFYFSNENYVFVGGGHQNSWHQYNLETEVWTPIDDLPQGRVAGSQLQHNGHGLLLGGDKSSHQHVPAQQTFMSYDINNAIWDYLPEIPGGSKWAPSSFIAGGAIHFFGGISYNNQSDSRVWKLDLDILECLPASNMTINNLLDKQADLFWLNNLEADTDTLKWKRVGVTDWNIVPNPTAPYTLTGLKACVDYEFKITTQCGNLIHDAKVFPFKTDGCCTNPDIELLEQGSDFFRLEWADILAADIYELRYKKTNETDWNYINASTNQLDLIDLGVCNEYEVQIKSVCEIETIDFSESSEFITIGCGNCTDLNYCSVDGLYTATDGYIKSVGINGTFNNQGHNDGYDSFLLNDLEAMDPSSDLELVVDVFKENSSALLFLHGWIDYNDDGTFSEDEKIFDDIIAIDIQLFTIPLPANLTPGIKRMRLMLDGAIVGTSCGELSALEGETEDYCIEINMVTSTENLRSNNLQLDIFPNPVLNKINFKNPNLGFEADVVITNILGKPVLIQNNFDFVNPLDVQELGGGIYFLSIRRADEILSTIKFIKQE